MAVVHACPCVCVCVCTVYSVHGCVFAPIVCLCMIEWGEREREREREKSEYNR